MGQILLGNVSLTIENATESDNGLFCCKLQIKRMSGVQKVTISLKVQPGKLALFLCLFLASERSSLFATNCFSYNKEMKVLINMFVIVTCF